MMYSSARYLSELRDVIGPICSAGKIFAVTLRSEREECAVLSGDRRRCMPYKREREVNIRVWDVSHGSSYPNYSAQMLLADGDGELGAVQQPRPCSVCGGRRD